MKTYTFHVSLPGISKLWRKVEVASDQTLADLHDAIQRAFDFDSDHLYSFFMSGKAWDRDSEYCLPEGLDPWVDAMSMEEDEDFDDDDDEAEELPTPQDLRSMFDALKTDEQLRAEFTRSMVEDLGVPKYIADRMLGDLGTLVDESSDEDLNALVSEVDESIDAQGDVRTTTLESLALKKGQTFLYLFDYGDEWRFKVRVHAINAEASDEAVYPRLVAELGEAPSQYGDWDDDEEWEDEEA